MAAFEFLKGLYLVAKAGLQNRARPRMQKALVHSQFLGVGIHLSKNKNSNYCSEAVLFY